MIIKSGREIHEARKGLWAFFLIVLRDADWLSERITWKLLYMHVIWMH